MGILSNRKTSAPLIYPLSLHDALPISFGTRTKEPPRPNDAEGHCTAILSQTIHTQRTQGNTNALKHGRYGAEAIASRLTLTARVRTMKLIAKEVSGPDH